MFTIISHGFINIFRTINFSWIIHQGEWEKYIGFPLILQEVWKKNLKQSDRAPTRYQTVKRWYKKRQDVITYPKSVSDVWRIYPKVVSDNRRNFSGLLCQCFGHHIFGKLFGFVTTLHLTERTVIHADY